MLRPAISLLLFFTALTGLAYPLSVTGAGQLLMPIRANGSDHLIGRHYTRDDQFHGRPSATTPPYNREASGGSNLGPLHPARRFRPDLPIDLATASGSGLDPHISPEAAFFQVERIARAKKVGKTALENLIKAHIEERTAGIWGERRVNVVLLNRALAELR